MIYTTVTWFAGIYKEFLWNPTGTHHPLPGGPPATAPQWITPKDFLTEIIDLGMDHIFFYMSSTIFIFIYILTYIILYNIIFCLLTFVSKYGIIYLVYVFRYTTSYNLLG